LIGQTPPSNVLLQLIIYQNYATPLANGCNLSVQSHFVPVANITSVTFATLQELLQPTALNTGVPGLALAPGQTALITLRAIDTTTNSPLTALGDYNPVTQASPVIVSQGANTGTQQPPATLTILTKSLPTAADLGYLYTQTIAATGGTGTLNFTPQTVDGVSLNAAGQFSGIPTSTGSFPFTATVTDANNVSASQPLTLVVNPAPSISTTTATLQVAEQGVAYSQQIGATGGTGTLAFTQLSGGSAVDGLTLSTSGLLSGNPTAAGTYPFTATVTDALNVSVNKQLTLTVAPVPPSITSPTNGFSTTSPVTVSGTSLAGATTIAVLDSGTQVGTAAPNGTTWSTSVALSVGSGHSLTATQTVNGIASAASAPAVTGTIVSPVTLNSIAVAPTPHTSYSGDTVWMNYDWPGQGTVLYNGGSATVGPYGALFSADANGVNVNVTNAQIAVTFPNGWNFNTSPVSLDGLAITDPLATITGVSLASTNIAGFTGSASQLFFDGNDVYINFPHPAFTSLNAGASVTVNVQFASTAPAPPYGLPVGTTQQFTATGNYSNSTTQDLTGLATWGANSTPFGAATVNAGLVSAVTNGTSTITATYSGVHGSATVVSPALVSIAITPAFPSPIQGTNTEQFTATGTYTDGPTQNLTNSVTWASSATSVATINSSGLATGVGQGITTISAALGGVTGTMLLTDGVTIGTTVLPNGEFNSPYTPAGLSISGGMPPYTVSLGQNAILPAGMTLDSSGSTCGTPGTFCGTPAQAGLWNVPIVVTDSSPTPLMQAATVQLTIGLATGYAGGSNCYMPYPATPLYYAGATAWALTGVSPSSGSSTLIDSQMTVQGNILAGCLAGSGSITSGAYTLTFSINGGPSTLSLPLNVVGQDYQDNGQYFVYSGGTYGELPPNSNQQGVLSPGQSSIPFYLGSLGADDEDFNGNFVFGFQGLGVDPNGCVTSAYVNLGEGSAYLNLSAAPSNPGRYDLLFNGITSPCPSAFPAAFPTTPTPIVFASADVIGTTVYNPPTPGSGAEIWSVMLSGSGGTSAANNVLEFENGSSTPIQVGVAFNYSIVQDPYCPACIDQIAVGLNTDQVPQACVYDSGVSGLPYSGSASFTINVPNTPGRYYIAINRLEDFSCAQATSATWSIPTPSQYIGVVDVWPGQPSQ